MKNTVDPNALRSTLIAAKNKALYITENYPTPNSLTGNMLELIALLNAALDVPQRNCERFATAEEAKREFNYLWNFVWQRGGGCFDERRYNSEYEKWLFDVKDGATDGSK